MTSTSIRRPGTIDPGRWPDVAVAAGSPGRAAVARVLFGTAIIRLPVRVRLPDGSLHGAGGPAAPVMRLHRPQEFFRRIGASGLIGFGESYMAGEWDSTDLTGLLTVFAAHATELVPPWLQRLRRLAVRRHPPDDLQTIPGARRNIGRHYDLSNDLFALFLDETMTYSAALFPERDGATAAGDLAEATGTPTSPPSTGTWPRAGGSGCRRSRSRTTGCWPPGTPTPGSRSTSFPAGCSRPVTAIGDSLARTTLRITGREDFGDCYAETLRIWRERFGAQAGEVARLGFDEVFNRMWTFYLCYSEAGFRAGYIDVSQLTLARP